MLASTLASFVASFVDVSYPCTHDIEANYVAHTEPDSVAHTKSNPVAHTTLVPMLPVRWYSCRIRSP